MHGTHQATLPRPLRNQESTSENSREKLPENEQRFSRYAHEDLKFSKQFEPNNRKPTTKHNITNYLDKPISKFSDNKYLQRQKSLIREREELKDEIREKERENEIIRENFRKSLEKELLNKNGNKYLEKSLSNSDRYYEEEKAKNRYNHNERERNGRYGDEGKKNDRIVQYYEDDGFDENIRSRNSSTDFDKDRPSISFSYEEVFFEEQRPYNEYPVAKTRQKFNEKEESNGRVYSGNKENVRAKINPIDPRYYEQKGPPRTQRTSRDIERNFQRSNKEDFSYDSNRERYYYKDTTNSITRRQPQYRQRSPSPEEVKAPRDRFKDAKEKFLLMEKQRLENERRRPEPPISPTIQKDKIHFVKRHQSMAYTSKDHLRNNYEDRYSNDRREFSDEIRPKPAPRQVTEEVRYRNNRENDKDGFRNLDKYDPKRRSMYSLIEEEHKKNSNEIAKELKRRSFIDFGHQSFEEDATDFSRDQENDIRNNRHFHELPETDRYTHPIANNHSKSSHNLDKMAETKYDMKYVKNPQKTFKSTPGYRHSYSEPKVMIEAKKSNMTEMLQRTNSTVGYNMQTRVGIASVHPY